MWQRGFLDKNTEFSEYEKIMSLIVILINVSSLFIKINMIIHWRSMYKMLYVLGINMKEKKFEYIHNVQTSVRYKKKLYLNSFNTTTCKERSCHDVW